MVNFIYLAHSQERFRKQAVFSILSLLEYMNPEKLDYRIVVYTDEPDYFGSVPVETVVISRQQIDEWTRPIDYIHRAKLCLLIDAAERFKGAIVTLDSDNCFRKNPTRYLNEWKGDTVFMEKLEYALQKPADLVGKKYKRFFTKKRVFTGVSQTYEVSMTQECWNSGVLGIQDPQRPYLKDALAVCDDLHTSFRKHISEQLASSIVLSKHFKIVPFRDYTYHWFGHGQAINKIIDHVLADYPNQDLAELIKNVRAVKQEVIDAPLNRDKQPWYKRWFN